MSAAELPAGTEELLRERLALGLLRDEAVKRARRGKAAEAEELWDGVLGGHSVLLDCFQQGEYRYYVVLPHSDARATLRDLGRRTTAVLGGLAPSPRSASSPSRRS